MSGKPRRFKRYPAYKESGVEWLEEIPEAWQVRRLKYIASLNPDSLPEDTDPSMEMTYVDIGGVNNLGEIVERENLLFAAAPSRARRVVQRGDVIVSTVRTYLRAIAAIKGEQGLVVSTGFAVVRPEQGLLSAYAAYALRAPYFVERVVAESKGVSFPAISETDMATFEIAFPSMNEQRAIAAFLDRETSRIDTLVAKKERLIELLQEKRSASITSAVTKGIDPNARMKHSGVDSLGEIPMHWRSKPYKHVCERVFVGIAEAATFAYVDDGVPLLRSTDVRSNRIRTDDIRSIDRRFADRLRSKMLKTGDIVIVRTGNAGVSAIVPPEYDGGQCFTLVVSRPLRKEVSKFLSYALNSEAVQSQFTVEGMGTAQINISVPIVQNVQIAVPPLAEQQQIADWIDAGAARLDALIALTKDAVSGLNELRTALISAAVTGKIDVREGVA
jgi:type I restriction enzyme S subunit